MNKINNIKQLNEEKKRLTERQKELEKAIRYDWLDLKNSLSPKSVAKRLFAKKDTEKERQTSSLINDTLSQLAGRLTNKLAEKAESKIYKWFKR